MDWPGEVNKAGENVLCVLVLVDDESGSGRWRIILVMRDVK